MVGVGGGGAAAEFVDGEGEGNEGEGEVETALGGEGLAGGLRGGERGRGRVERGGGRSTPRDSLTGSGCGGCEVGWCAPAESACPVEES